MQHASDLWHPTFGSMAITIINTVYENSDDDFLTNNDCQVFIKQQLKDLNFLYGDTESKV